jgi:hypothetical protein
MVHKIIDSKYRVFIDSALITILILIIGFSMGIFVESYRTDKIADFYKDYEIEALDLKLQNYYYQIMDQSTCEEAIEQNFIFADNLYEKGLELERFEEANQITDNILREKRRYVLLKTELWLNSILLKEKCEDPFDTVVYLYSADPANNIKVAQQKVISNNLKTVKENQGNNIILLPIAGDMRLTTKETDPKLGIINLQMNVYKIKDFPAIIINEETVLYGYNSVEEIESYLTDRDKIKPRDGSIIKL